MKHTKLPWIYGTAANYDGFYIAPQNTLPTLGAVRTIGGNIDITTFNFPAEAEANAAFIVKAVNNHAKLLGALKNLLNYLESDDMSDLDLNLAREAIKEAEL